MRRGITQKSGETKKEQLDKIYRLLLELGAKESV